MLSFPPKFLQPLPQDNHAAPHRPIGHSHRSSLWPIYLDPSCIRLCKTTKICGLCSDLPFLNHHFILGNLHTLNGTTLTMILCRKDEESGICSGGTCTFPLGRHLLRCHKLHELHSESQVLTRLIDLLTSYVISSQTKG